MRAEESGLTWNAAARSYIAECRARNLSPSTLLSYEMWLLGPRSQRIRAEHGVTNIAQLTRDTLTAFGADCHEGKLSPYTVRQSFRVLATFAKYCHSRGWIDAGEILSMRAPKVPLVIPDAFSEDEVSALLRACRSERDRILLKFMVGTGLRASEVCNVTLDDLEDHEAGAVIRVRRGKGAKDRWAPLGLPKHPLVRDINRYIAHVRPMPPEDMIERHLWLTDRRSILSGDYAPLTVDTLYTFMNRLGQAIGIHAHPHRCRHTWATRCLAAGIPAEAVRKAGGWGSFEAMSRYLHLSAHEVLTSWRRLGDPSDEPGHLITARGSADLRPSATLMRGESLVRACDLDYGRAVGQVVRQDAVAANMQEVPFTLPIASRPATAAIPPRRDVHAYDEGARAERRGAAIDRR